MKIIKNIAPKILRVTLVLLVTCSLLLFFSQKKFENNLYGKYMPEVMGNFINEVFHLSFFSVIISWFEVDSSNINVNTREKMISYKLELISKSLNNYFKSLLQETDKLISHYNVYQLLQGNSYEPDQLQLKNHFKKYIKNNLDILEISLYKADGEKLSSVKYRNVPDYAINQKIINKLQNQDNLFIKSSANQNLVLISAIRNQSPQNSKNVPSEIIGIVSQTINPIFFTKILDFLNVNDDLFYIKSAEDEYIVDNYSAYQFIQNKSLSFPYLIYQKLSRTRDSKLNLNVNEVNFSIGVIIRENNMAGNIVAFLCFLLLLYIGFVLIQFFSRHVQFLKKPLTNSGIEIDNPIDTINLTKDKDIKQKSNSYFDSVESPKLNLSFLKDANKPFKTHAPLTPFKDLSKDNKIAFENTSFHAGDDKQSDALANSK